ncbi:hypothetical protein [Salinisphaera japonica]|uniref:hypothetical protein n=1 Tax=Salinisphaera japonica TaxID=1304270 RepID=UPI001618B938|nr:hypothetical protein [Salinisphaera japonica]
MSWVIVVSKLGGDSLGHSSADFADCTDSVSALKFFAGLLLFEDIYPQMDADERRWRLGCRADARFVAPCVTGCAWAFRNSTMFYIALFHLVS